MLRVLIFSTLFLFLFQPVVYGEDSAFGELIGKEEGDKLREVDNVVNFDIEKYKEFKAKYDDVFYIYNNSFGDDKDEAEAQLLALSKDLMLIKLGVVRGRVKDYSSLLDKYNFTENEKNKYTSLINSYNSFVEDMEEKINSISTLSGVDPVSFEINQNLFEDRRENTGYIQKFKFLIVRPSVSVGLDTISKTREQFPAIEKHLSAAAEAGVSLTETQQKYDNAKKDLERIKAGYDDILEQLAVGEDIDTKVSITSGFNYDLKADLEDVKQVVSYLRDQYGISPWKLD